MTTWHLHECHDCGKNYECSRAECRGKEKALCYSCERQSMLSSALRNAINRLTQAMDYISGCKGKAKLELQKKLEEEIVSATSILCDKPEFHEHDQERRRREWQYRNKIRRKEWIHPTLTPFCPSCFSQESEGHKEDCEVGKYLDLIGREFEKWS